MSRDKILHKIKALVSQERYQEAMALYRELELGE